MFATPISSARASHNTNSNYEKPRYSAAHLQQAASFWIHDDGSNHGDRPLSRVFAGEHCTPIGRKLTRRKLPFVLGFITLVLVIIAAVLGGVLGSRAHASEAPAESPGSDSPGSPGISEPVEALVNNGSRLATWFMPHPPAVGDSRSLMSQFLIFQDVIGDLIVSEWYEDKLESYRLDQRLANLPKPLPGSQIRAASFGQAEDLHVFYLDDTQVLRHLVRITGHDSKVEWKLDPAFSTDGAQNHVASGLLLSASVLPLIDNGSSDGRLGVVYWNGAKQNTFTLLTTSTSDALSGWSSMEVPIDSDLDQQAQELQDGSTGVVMLPLAVNISGGDTPKGKLEPGARIIWDLSNKNHPASLGFVDCVLGRPDLNKTCWPVANITWRGMLAAQAIMSGDD